MRRNALIAAIGAALALLGAPAAAAMQLSVSAQGVPYLSGGTKAGERQLLEQLSSRYGLWLILRDRESGEPLSGVHVRVIDATARKLVFERTLQNPWLMLDLPAGHYQVEARFDDELRRWSVVSHADDAQPQVLYLDAVG